MIKIGERVGTIYSCKNGIAEFLGYGTYQGREIPTEIAVGMLAESLRDAGIENPKILLDSGSVVYGCECWWGPEEIVKRELKKCKKVKKVEIYEVRKEIK